MNNLMLTALMLPVWQVVALVIVVLLIVLFACRSQRSGKAVTSILAGDKKKPLKR